jgi:hypothetical protein
LIEGSLEMLWSGEKEEEKGRRWQLIRKGSSALAFALASLASKSYKICIQGHCTTSD